MPVLGAILFLSGLFVLVFLMIRILRLIIQRRESKKRWIYTQSNFLNASIFVLSLVLLLFSWLFLWTGRSLRSFNIFQTQVKVGKMEVIRETELTTRLVLTLFRSDGKSYTQNFFITGEKLQLEAEFLDFKPSLKSLGIRPCYKMVRINVLDLADSLSAEKSKAKPIIFELLEGGTDLFLWTKKLDNILPWVETRVLKSDFSTVAEKEIKIIYLTKERIDLS
ncbi:MAG: hypothetical protein AMJ90_05940 [candidate division Zixibacteria bacterium SM23_73_2]|nr:MAG: hypothetical protein AMJ90_05940 [candidate division Zixibacteria bacterium SM23_73_2]